MKNNSTPKDWAFWPVILLAFFYPVNSALMVVTVPLYYFKIGVRIEHIGILVAGVAITYSFSPILLDKVSERIGRKRSIIIAMAGMSAAQSTYFITLEPMVFLIARLVEGFFMGSFWTKLQSSISDTPPELHGLYTSKYNISWNGGIIVGSIIGAIFIFLLDDLKLVFLFVPFLLYVSLIVAIFLFHEPPERSNEFINLNNQDSENGENKKHFFVFSIPLIIPILCIIAFGLVKGIVNFLYPIKSELLGFATFTVYLMPLFLILAQLISTAMASLITFRALKIMITISIAVLSIALLLLGLNSNFFVFFVLFLAIGFFAGILYGASLKLFITLNVKNETSKFTGILETLIGTMFLIGPVIAGFIAIIDINLGFYLISMVLIFILIINLIFIRRIKIE